MNLPAQKIVPLIIGCALFMQQMDSTALTTALPAMAASLHVPTLRLHLTITSYLLASALFLPTSGWVGDRFGTRRVFCMAILVFTAGSICCGLSTNLTMLICGRIVQGLGGAMMVPVGRIILVRSVEKKELLAALVLMSMTAIVGPAAGPLLGGAITTYISWCWIFWINVPVGILGVSLTILFINNVPTVTAKPFDWRGFMLTAVGFGGVFSSLDSLSGQNGAGLASFILALVGAAALALYFVYYRNINNPILDLRLFHIPTFRVSVIGGTIFRLGFDATPFLLPLLMQIGFGFSPLQSGTTTFISSIGSFAMRTISKRILKICGFRTVLIVNALIASLCVAIDGTFDYGTSRVFMMLIIFLGGTFGALQLTGTNTIAFAEVTADQMRDTTILTQMANRVGEVGSIAIAALVLGIVSRGSHLSMQTFPIAFFVAGAFSALSVLSFYRLSTQAGAEIAGRTDSLV